jgi:hypothetical protein
VPLILGYGAKEGDETAAQRLGEVVMGLVQHLDQRTAVVDPLDDFDAVEHQAGRPVPFRNDQYIAGAELVDRLLELGPVLDALARGLLAEDHVNAFGPERAELAVEVLMSAADPAVADFARRISIQIC